MTQTFLGEKFPARSGVRAQSPERNANYAQAASWAADIHGSLRASRRAAWIIAGAAVVVAVLEALALTALTPLKTVVPYTILVDRQTGYVQTLQGLKPGPLTQDQAVTQSFPGPVRDRAGDLRRRRSSGKLPQDHAVVGGQRPKCAYRQDMAKTKPY